MLYQILRNRLYRGQIAHRGHIHQGNHQPIVDAGLWDAVQDCLEQQPRRRRGSFKSTSATAPLAGVLFDDAGHRLTPTTTHKGNRRYRYYVSAPLVRGVGIEDGIRVPAHDLERLVSDALRHHLQDASWLTGQLLPGSSNPGLLTAIIDASVQFVDDLDDNREAKRQNLLQRVPLVRVTVSRSNIQIQLMRTAILKALGPPEKTELAEITEADEPVEITVPAQALRLGKIVRFVLGEVTTVPHAVDPALVRLIANAYRWFDDLRTGRVTTIAEIAARDRQQVSHVSRTIGLAFLAPDLVEMIVEGRQPITLTSERLKSRHSTIPASWSAQRALLLV